MKKYELTGVTKVFCGRTLHRIRALIDFNDVKTGDFGGWIEAEENLRQWGNAWVSGNARVSGNAWVYGDAQVSGNALVHSDARVCDRARVFGDMRVSGNALVSGNAQVYGNAWVDGDAQVYGNAWVDGDAQVYGNARVFDLAKVCGGRWKRSPLYILGTEFPFNVASDNMVRCGCQMHTWKEWYERYMQIAKEHNAEGIVAEYILYFNLACKMYGHEDCMIPEGKE